MERLANVILHKPQKGFQENLLKTDKVNFVIAGSGAGVGKTWVELMDAVRHQGVKDYYAVVFRRTYQQIFSSIVPQAIKLYSGIRNAKFVKSPHPNYSFYNDKKMRSLRSRIQFSQMLYDTDTLNWQGAEIPRFYFDEITHFSKHQVTYMFSRMRSMSGVTPRLMGTCNPDPDSFILDLLDAGKYIQQDGYADPDMSGRIQWMVHKDDEFIFDRDKESLWNKTGIRPMSFTFVPGSLYDNKIMLDQNPHYESMLQGLSEYEKMLLLHGNWRAKREGKIFKRTMFKEYWEDDIFNTIQITHKAIFCDTAQTQGKASDYTVFLCAGLTTDRRLIILDMIRGRFAPMETYRIAEAFYHKHNVKEYTVTNQEKGTTSVIRSAPLMGLFAEWANRGIDILQHLKNEKGLNVGPIKRQGALREGQRGNDKISRAIAVLPLLNRSGIWLPGGNTRWTGYDSWCDSRVKGILEAGESVRTIPLKWKDDLKNEMLSFSQGENKKEVAAQHDDITDTVVDAATFLLETKGLSWLQGMLAL